MWHSLHYGECHKAQYVRLCLAPTMSGAVVRESLGAEWDGPNDRSGGGALSPGCRGCRGCRGPVEGLSRVLSRGCRGAVKLTPCVCAVEVSRSLSSVETVEVSRVSRAVEGVESIVCREYIDVDNSYRHMTVPSLYTKGQTNRHTLSSEPRSEHIMAQALVSSLIGLIG